MMKTAPAGPATTFVLVHGGWHGGWCYARTARLLRAQGHEVYAPSLTGLGDRAHLVARSIGLSTHIEDIVHLLKWEGLNNVVLCGHSYGGMVISGVASQVPERLAGLVYIDAVLPGNGNAMLDALPPDRGDRFRTAATQRGHGWLVPPTPAAIFNVNSSDAEWVDRLCVPHPLRCFEEPVHVSEASQSLPRHYIVATDFPHSSFPQLAEGLRKHRGWRVDEIVTGHDVMVDDPKGLANCLLDRWENSVEGAPLNRG